MSTAKNKDLVCLLAAVVSEMLNDSDDDDDLMPLKAMLEARKVVNTDEQPSPKKSKHNSRTSHVDSFMSLKAVFEGPTVVFGEQASPKKPKLEQTKAPNEIDKYSQPSRFEDPSILQAPDTFSVDELICRNSLKPTTECFCSNHVNLQALSLFSLLVVNQIGGELLTDIDFKANWHMTKGTVEALYQILSCNDKGISAMEFLAFLWSLATNEAADAVETRFKMDKGEITLLERRVYDVILSKRFSYERWPQGVAANFVSEGFRKVCGLRGALGVVDCVHFPYIGTPYPGTFQNWRNNKTIVFELACDHRGIFTYSSYFWWPGKWTHKEVHRNASLSSYPLPEGCFLLAEPAYARLKNFVTPFPEPKSPNMKTFNKQHLYAMRIMKHAIGCLATRFNAVQYFSERTPWVLRKRFASCVLLHNLCTELEGAIDIDEALDLGPYFSRGPLPPHRDGEDLIRNRLLTEMMIVDEN